MLTAWLRDHVAGKTSKIFPAKVQGLYPKLINSETTRVTYLSIPPIPEEWRDGDLTSRDTSAGDSCRISF